MSKIKNQNNTNSWFWLKYCVVSADDIALGYVSHHHNMHLYILIYSASCIYVFFYEYERNVGQRAVFLVMTTPPPASTLAICISLQIWHQQYMKENESQNSLDARGAISRGMTLYV